jgi:NitT/TauT family transport system substrate-binding protein
MQHQCGDDARPLSRRTLLRGAAGLGLAAATGTLLPACGSGGDDERQAGGAKSEPPPETTSIRLFKIPPFSCVGAMAMAESFLRDEGFTDIQYPQLAPPTALEKMAAGEIDFGMGIGAGFLLAQDAGAPLVQLGGIHVGCWQVFGTGGIRSIRDFKGKTVAIAGPKFTDGIYMAMTLANVGLDLRQDVKLIQYPPTEYARVLSSGEVDAVVALPPLSQTLRAKGIGHVVLDSMTDRPWSEYYCCTAVANRNWMEKHPVATKRALRALLKGADVVAREPERAARALVDLGFTPDYDLAVQNLREIPYGVWREFDPADSLRFYALRMKEAELITSTPEQLIERGTDFRYFAELKKELKEA